ncbi:protein mei2-like [Anaeramoeba flamelloides]|uniref:Protein mei2-like n=1 Tax=Anaeramoeba flamelloides TaxID=1746091 RepID=A0AAV7Z412_9EUKA|nr:protein mei2-like [Anaeramoeba flamelloides]
MASNNLSPKPQQKEKYASTNNIFQKKNINRSLIPIISQTFRSFNLGTEQSYGLQFKEWKQGKTEQSKTNYNNLSITNSLEQFYYNKTVKPKRTIPNKQQVEKTNKLLHNKVSSSQSTVLKKTKQRSEIFNQKLLEIHKPEPQENVSVPKIEKNLRKIWQFVPNKIEEPNFTQFKNNPKNLTNINQNSFSPFFNFEKEEKSQQENVQKQKQKQKQIESQKQKQKQKEFSQTLETFQSFQNYKPKQVKRKNSLTDSKQIYSSIRNPNNNRNKQGRMTTREHPLGENPSRTLFVRNIDSKTSDDELYQIFQKYGRISSIYSKTKYRGFVMVQFCDLRDATTAIKMLQGYTIHSRKIDIHFSIPKCNKKKLPIENEGCLRCQNLPMTLPEKEIWNLFAIYGDIRGISDSLDSKDKIVEYFDIRDSEKAFQELDMKRIRGKTIRLLFYKKPTIQLNSPKIETFKEMNSLDNKQRQVQQEKYHPNQQQQQQQQQTQIIKLYQFHQQQQQQQQPRSQQRGQQQQYQNTDFFQNIHYFPQKNQTNQQQQQEQQPQQRQTYVYPQYGYAQQMYFQNSQPYYEQTSSTQYFPNSQSPFN